MYYVNCTSRGITFAIYTFGHKQDAEAKVDELLKQGIQSGIQQGRYNGNGKR